MEKISGSFAALEEKCVKDQDTHAEAQKHFHAVSAGLSKNTEGEDASLNDQLMGLFNYNNKENYKIVAK